MTDFAELRAEIVACQEEGFSSFHIEVEQAVAILDELESLRAAAPKVKPKKADYPPEFIDAMGAMERAGIKWLGGSTLPGAFAAWKARKTAGATPAEMLAGADKYARFCKATDRKVMMAQTFFGPQEFFSADWTIERPSQAARPGKFDPVAHVNQRSAGKDWDDGIIDITPR